ncbi:zinc finger CCCH domain-containing protein 10-like isoform X1 [Asterias amurensis]|uniref:zinc finger CCCH domain-containing protein 10-like isoform X1 n=1 Tax=Asterias amurensis TaxID=7602 RepID=UPI003AB2FD67
MSSEEKDYGDDVCRDFLRNVCNRGKSCKFKHPEDAEGSESRGGGNSHQRYAFCHDFQNRECVRGNCRFLHCSRAEEDYYKETGKLPPHLEDKVSRGYGVGGEELRSGNDDVPVCRDYQKGECNRGSKCKFRHMSRGDVDYEDRRRMRAFYDPYGDFEFDRIRRRPPFESRFGYLDFETGRSADDHYGARSAIRERMRSASRDTRDLEDENQVLLRKVEAMRKQISDLTAANEVLLEQNARLRASKVENTTNAILQAETHLVRSTATGVPLLSQGSVAVIQKNAGSQGASGVTAINLIGQQEGGLGDRSQTTLIAPDMQTIPVSVSLQQEFQPVSISSVMTTQPSLPLPTSILTYPIVSHNIHTGLGR